ncbi:pleckstrin homology domain-containing family S member 1 [Danio aesculapii]|uniref:pleckstrin homology domain-containing family S member 1 n=1 Tax=Danio aesculapii TaxID=1142201 RepID=UPI0024BFE80E|nr:pleckstrin homology domain-containing family S member 1 [Danio aesculapii]
MSNKTKSSNAKFYKEPVMVEEMYTGYLQKSPASPIIAKNLLSQKSWKRRFFVLSKTVDNNHQLTYYPSNEKRDKPLGKIDLSKISLLFTSPETHPTWDWIQKHFKCPSSSVLFMTVETRDYFLIGQNSDDVDGWLNAIVTALKKSQCKPNTDDPPQDNRIRSISAPLNCSEPKVEDHHDERWSAPALMSASFSTQSHYDYPRKFSEPSVPAERKLSVIEVQDEKTKEEDKSPEKSSEYMCMASVQIALEDDQQEKSTACAQSCIDGRDPSVCNGAVNEETDAENQKTNKEKRNSDSREHSQPRHHNFNGNHASTELDKAPSNKSGTETHVEKEICISQNSLKNCLVLTEEEGKPCVSECRQSEDSCLFHKGDQILAFNDLLIDTVDEIQTYLRRLSKDEVKLTIRRLPGSQPLHSEACPSH